MYGRGSTTLATLYTSRTKATAAANPFVTDSAGNGVFFADPGEYDLSVGSSTIAVTVPVDPFETARMVIPNAVGDGVTDDTAAIQAAIDKAAAGSGMVGLPFTLTGYLCGNLTVPTVGTPTIAPGLVVEGLGAFVPIIYSGSGTLFNLPGTSGSVTVPYVTLRNLRLLKAGTQGVGKAISANYAQVCTLDHVFIKGFSKGVELVSNCTGWKLYQAQITRCGTGLTLGAGCGGFDWFGGQLDTNAVGFDINGSMTGVSLNGIEIDTDVQGGTKYNTSGSYAGRVRGGAARVRFSGVRVFAENSLPSGINASVLVDAIDVSFADDCFFHGDASTTPGVTPVPAAIEVAATASFVKIGGHTTLHSVSSYRVLTGAANILLTDPSNGEATLVSGTGATIPTVLRTEATSLVVKGAVIADGSKVIVRNGDAVQMNSTDNTDSVSWAWSDFALYGGGRAVMLDERTDPTAPAVNQGKLYLRDNGSGKTQFCVRFNTGAVQVIATQP